jgi:transcription antitermination factor NusG
MQNHYEFAEGDLVEVIDGLFAGRSVPVKSIAGNKAKVVLALFGGLVDELEVPLGIFVAAE